jgi:hypothetical protein
MKNIIKNILRKLNLEIVSTGRLDALESSELLAGKLITLIATEKNIKAPSKSQIFQDLFVLLSTGFKQHGYFVEFGATNGVDLSNTYLLEKHFQWNGILAEPSKAWHQKLKENRSCSLEFDCV